MVTLNSIETTITFTVAADGTNDTVTSHITLTTPGAQFMTDAALCHQIGLLEALKEGDLLEFIKGQSVVVFKPPPIPATDDQDKPF